MEVEGYDRNFIYKSIDTIHEIVDSREENKTKGGNAGMGQMEVATMRNWKVVNTFNGGTIQEELTHDEAHKLADEKRNGAPVPSSWVQDFNYEANCWTWRSPDWSGFMV